MKEFYLRLVAVAGLTASLGSTAAFAQQTPSVLMEPCTHWRPEPGTIYYVCAGVSRGARFYEAQTIDTLLARMQARIQNLEERLDEIENDPRN